MAKIMIVAGLAGSLLNFRRELIEEWLAAGHKVVAAAPEDTVKHELAEMGVGYHRVPLKRAGLSPLKDSLLFFKLIFLLYKEKPDYLFLYTIKPVIYGSLAAFLKPGVRVYTMITGLGFVFMEGGGKKRALLKKLISFLYRLSLKRSRKVFFQNPDDRAEFTSAGLVKPEKTVLINGSGVNLERFKKEAWPGKINFLLIARLLIDKGVYEFKEAAEVVKSKHPEVTFTLVGRFDENPSAVRREDVEAWHEAGLIYYGGQVSDVRPLIAECSVYVLPSYREGTPRTVLEAMAMGRAIITSDAPGCRETVVEGVNGYLVPVKDSSALAEAMLKFVEEPALIKTMGEESRKLAEDKYDVNKVNADILEAMGLK